MNFRVLVSYFIFSDEFREIAQKEFKTGGYRLVLTIKTYTLITDIPPSVSVPIMRRPTGRVHRKSRLCLYLVCGVFQVRRLSGTPGGSPLFLQRW